MISLTPAERRACRAKAHSLRPFVTIGHHGLTPAVVHEIDLALTVHELIKIRVFSGDRDERDALLERICTALEAAPVQHLGKTLVVFRPAPEAEAALPAALPRKATVRTAPKARRRKEGAEGKATGRPRRRLAR